MSRMTIRDAALLPYEVGTEGEAWDMWCVSAQNTAFDARHPDDSGLPESNENHTLYVYTDRQGGVLYVGTTNDVARGLSEHQEGSSWFRTATGYHWFSGICCRACCLDMYTAAIRQFHPRHNVVEVS